MLASSWVYKASIYYGRWIVALVVIEDPEDPRLAPFRLNERGLASRAEKRDDRGAGLFLAEGDLVVERAHAAGCRPVTALADAARIPSIAHELGVDVFVGGDDVRRAILQRGAVQPIVALFERPARPSLTQFAEGARRLIIAEAVDNPINVGAIVRNAAALGWDGLLLDYTSADPLARRALRVAMGTAFTLPHARTRHLLDALDELRRAGFLLVALTPSEDAPTLDDVAHQLVRTSTPQILTEETCQPGPDPSVEIPATSDDEILIGETCHSGLDPSVKIGLVVGAEREGVSGDVIERVDVCGRIPMHQAVDSLNVAAATAIACYALRPGGGA